MKRIVGIILTGLLTTSLLLTGCSGGKVAIDSKEEIQVSTPKQGEKEKETSKPIELTLWHEIEAPIADTLQEELKKLEPEIKVNVVRKDQMQEALKLMSIGGGNDGPDLVWAAHDMIGNLATIKAIQPIDEFMTGANDKFLPVAQKAGQFKGQTYQVPVYYETYITLYNKKLLNEAPKNTDDMLNVMKTMTKDGNYGFVWQHSTAYYVGAWINGFGGNIINEEAQVGLNTEETLEAINYHKEFVKYMPKDGEWNTVTTLFYEGKAAATINGPWIIAAAKENGIDLGFAPLPTISKNNKPLTPFVGVQGVLMSSKTQNKEAAGKVIQLLLNKDLGEALALKTGAAPAQVEAYHNSEIANNALINVIKETASKGVPMPNIPEMGVVWSPTETALSAINKTEGTDSQEVLATAQQEIETKIQDMK